MAKRNLKLNVGGVKRTDENNNEFVFDQQEVQDSSEGDFYNKSVNFFSILFLLEAEQQELFF